MNLEEFNMKMMKLLVFFKENQEYFFSNREEFLQRYQQQNILFIHESGLRAFGLILAYLLATNQDINLLRKSLDGIINKEFLNYLIERNMQVFLIYQDISHRKQSQFTSLPIFQSTKFLLQAYFSGQITNFLDYHIISLQILANFIDNQLDIAKFFSPIYNNNLVFLQNDKAYKSNNIRYFVENLAILLTNEAAFLNTTNLLTFGKKTPDFRNHILTNILANFFIAFPKLNYKDLTNKIHKYLLNKNIEFKDHLLEIAELNTETKEFRLKLAFEDVYEPFFWGNVFELGAKYFDNLRDLSKKNAKIDLLLGVSAKYERNPLILSLIKTLNQADLLEFFIELLDLSKQLTEIVRISLKLLYLFMEYQGESELLIKIFIAKNEAKLLKNLEEMQTLKDFEEVHTSLAIIIKIINKISQSSIITNQIPHESGLSEKQLKREAQKKTLLAQFSQKQKAFIEKNQEDFGQNEVTEITGFSCCICHDKKEDSIEIFELSAYLAPDSLHNYYYLEREKGPYIISDNILNRERFLIISCHHQIHRDCLRAFLSNKKTQAYNNNIDPELNFKCFCCKFTCNLSVPIISPFVDQLPIKELSNIQNEKLEKSAEFICDFHEKMKVYDENPDVLLEKILLDKTVFRQSIDDFINKIMMHVINYKSSLCSEYYLIDILLESLIFFSEEAFSEGLDYYLKKRLFLNRNLFLITKNVFWNNKTSSSFNDFLINFKEHLFKDMEKLMILEENPVHFLRNIDIFIAKIMWKIAILLPLQKDHDITQDFLVFFAKIFINKFILVFSYFFLKENSHNPTLEEILKAFENYDFRIKVLSFLIPYYHLISSIFFVVFNFDAKLISEKLTKNLEINQEILQFSSLFGNLFSLSMEIMNNYFSNKWLNTLDSLNEIQVKIINSEILKNPGLKFSFSPNSYQFQTFYTKFINKKCENCKDFPRIMKADFYICIICETVLCNSYCFKQPKSIGNLTKHLLEKHCGKGFFINLMDTRVLFIDIPTAFLEDFLFSDSLGQNMTRKSVNWGDFYLNRGKLERLRSILVRREVSQEIYYHILKNSKDVIMTDQI